MNRSLNDLLNIFDSTFIKDVKGDKNILIEGLSYNSKLVKKDYAFFALDGLHVDGKQFISDAIKNGARLIFYTGQFEDFKEEVTYIKVENIRVFMSKFSSEFYFNPSGKLKVIGVTGTDGKSSVSYYIYQMLNAAGLKTGLISTVLIDDGFTLDKNPYRQSTPESTEIHNLFFTMIEAGLEYVVVESTSHGLDPRTARLLDVQYDIGVFTNISIEHLEFHKTLDAYVDAKLNLFRTVSNNKGFTIINAKDPQACKFVNVNKDYVTYALEDANAMVNAHSISEGLGEIEFQVDYKERTYIGYIALMGSFNVENILAACLVVERITKFDFQKILKIASEVKRLDGRMEVIKLGQGFDAVVDYAHTPGAFEKILPILKKIAYDKFIVVFGSAGERDVQKRSLQGRMADIYSDIIILCDEDPRGEPSLNIIKDIAKGIKNHIKDKDLFFIPDRRLAIAKAVSLAGRDDLVAVLGKGHESSIIYKDGAIEWNERAVFESEIIQALSKEERSK